MKQIKYIILYLLCLWKLFSHRLDIKLTLLIKVWVPTYWQVMALVWIRKNFQFLRFQFWLRFRNTRWRMYLTTCSGDSSECRSPGGHPPDSWGRRTLQRTHLPFVWIPPVHELPHPCSQALPIRLRIRKYHWFIQYCGSGSVGTVCFWLF